MADRIALCIEPDTGTADQITPVARAAGFQGPEHPERRRRDGVGPHQQAVRHHPERRAAQGRLRHLQQAAAQPEPARGAAGVDLVGGDAGDVRAAQEAEVARRRIPAQAAGGERVRRQGGGRWSAMGTATATTRSTSWTPIRTSCWPRTTTRHRQQRATTTRSATALMGGDGERRRATRRSRAVEDDGTPRRSRARSSIRRRRRRSRRWRRVARGGSPQSNDMVDLRNLWSDDDLPPNLGWEQAPAATRARARSRSMPARSQPPATIPISYRTGETLGPERDRFACAGAAPSAVPVPSWTKTSRPRPTSSSSATRHRDAAGACCTRRSPRLVDDSRVKEAEARNSELEARIHSLENERQTLRKEIEEARERFTQSATFSKEREFLGLREIINKKEKDILDLRDALDAKERQILDHKDKIRELDRARRDLDESFARLRAQPGRRQRAGRGAGAGSREVGRAREGAQGAARRRARGAAQGARGDRRAQEADGAGRGRARAAENERAARRRRVAAGRGRGGPPRRAGAS